MQPFLSLEKPAESASSNSLEDDMNVEIGGPVCSCRICFEECTTPELANLVAPCNCTGTQKWVHLHCLRKWQDKCQSRNIKDERAFRCSVCRSYYTHRPPKAASKFLHTILRTMAGAACITLVAFGCSGPPHWPHIGLLMIMLLLSTVRSPNTASLTLSLALLAAGCTILAFQTRGLRLILRMDDVGRLTLSLVKYSPYPIAGLRRGSLLIAGNELSSEGVFGQSVVLIYQYSRRGGSKGIILTQPLAEDSASAQYYKQHMDVGDAVGARPIKHFLGGPVGAEFKMPGERHGKKQVLVVHNGPSAAIPGSVELFACSSSEEEKDEDACTARSPQEDTLYYSTHNEALVQALKLSQIVLVYHGLCVWAEGQLEGEINSNYWDVALGQYDDVVRIKSNELRERLLDSGRILSHSPL